MLRLFHSSGPITLLLYFIFSLGMNAHYLFRQDEFQTAYETLAAHKVFIEWLHFDRIPIFITVLIHIFFVSFTGLLVSLLLQSNKMLQKSGLVPGAIFVTCLSIFPEISLVSPQVLCVFLIAIMHFRIFKTYNQQKVDNILFDTGILSACIALLYYPAILFSVYSMLAIFRLRSTSLREFLILLSGILVIFFLVFTAVYWYDMVQVFADGLYFPRKLPVIMLDTTALIRLLTIGSVLLISWWYLSRRFNTNLVQVRKYFGAVINLFIFSALVFFISPDVNLNQLPFVLLPVAIFISYYMMQHKSSITTESIFIGLVVTAILFQYINFA